MSQTSFDIDIRENWDKIDRNKFFPAVLRLDKMLVGAGLAHSSSEASRKRAERAVRINGNVVTVPYVSKFVPGELVIRVGKQIKRIFISTVTH